MYLTKNESFENYSTGGVTVVNILFGVAVNLKNTVNSSSSVHENLLYATDCHAFPLYLRWGVFCERSAAVTGVTYSKKRVKADKKLELNSPVEHSAQLKQSS